MIVEVQIRTIAQNFWAALEHQLRYKKNKENKEKLAPKYNEIQDIEY